MTTAFKPFTTANAVSSIDLLRPSAQAPSPEETLDVTIAAWTQAQQVEITPTPHGAQPKPSTSCTPGKPPSNRPPKTSI